MQIKITASTLEYDFGLNFHKNKWSRTKTANDSTTIIIGINIPIQFFILRAFLKPIPILPISFPSKVRVISFPSQ